MKRKTRVFSGVMTSEKTDREVINRKLARRAAAEGAVLLKNEGLLPLQEGMKIVLYGNGAVNAIKGGTGSGDVNVREEVPMLEGLQEAGLQVLNADELCIVRKAYQESRLAWRDQIFDLVNGQSAGSGMNFFDTYVSHPFTPPEGNVISPELVQQAQVCVYVISRIAGEGADRFDREGDYQLTVKEKEELKVLTEMGIPMVVLINAGGLIDTTAILENAGVKALMNLSHGGMEMGAAAGDLLTGKCVPSGKLTDTWARNYADYPGAATFSHNNGNVDIDKYEEGIFIGYRAFDTYQLPVNYPFGYGLSYTTFTLTACGLSYTENEVVTKVQVTNTGDRFSGREVVQIYASCPREGLSKEIKRLIGFGKTKVLAPGESVTMTIKSPVKLLASYDEQKHAWILAQGEYIILAGNSSANLQTAGILQAKEECLLEQLQPLMPLQQELCEKTAPEEYAAAQRKVWKQEAAQKGQKPVAFTAASLSVDRYPEHPLHQQAAQIAAKMSDEELSLLLLGEISKGQDNIHDNELVKTGIFVPGAAGETSCAFEESCNIPGISMADGPAGLRVIKAYEVDKQSGLIYGKSLLSALEGGLFGKNFVNENVDTYYQYATAIPVGSCLAQTWDIELIKELGAMIGSEMQLFGVAWWLAPGMNIHKNPLCGRNFEYYSEDPLVSGMMAAAMTQGVQSIPGVGTTIKHFACNSQEDNRMGVDAVISERALREIYLRGFEIAVKSAQPMCIMTSYNLINGTHSANNYDLCTKAARDEWDFQGIIMTDWTTTSNGSESYRCADAGNDLIMPGVPEDIDNIRAALKDGRLSRERAEACAARLITVIWQTLGMEDAPAYSSQFSLTDYVRAE